MKNKEPDITKSNIAPPKELTMFMFFSKKSANQFGHKTAYVKDNKSGRRKKVKYTATSSDEKANEYKWPDKKLIWQGSSSDFQFLGTEKPASQKYSDLPTR